MATHHLKTVVDLYLLARQKYDQAQIRSLLADDFKVQSPLKIDFSQLIKAFKPTQVERIFVDGDEACLIYLNGESGELSGTQVVEWLHFKDQKISAINFNFNAKPLIDHLAMI